MVYRWAPLAPYNWFFKCPFRSATSKHLTEMRRYELYLCANYIYLALCGQSGTWLSNFLQSNIFQNYNQFLCCWPRRWQEVTVWSNFSPPFRNHSDKRPISDANVVYGGCSQRWVSQVEINLRAVISLCVYTGLVLLLQVVIVCVVLIWYMFLSDKSKYALV